MKRRALWASLAVAVASCGDGYHGVITEGHPQELIGSWGATTFEYAGDAEQVDLVAAGGSLVLDLNEDHTCRLTMRLPGELTKVLDGTWTATPWEFTISYEDATSETTWYFDVWSMTATTLNLRQSWSEYDFNDDGAKEFAVLKLVLVRQ